MQSTRSSGRPGLLLAVIAVSGVVVRLRQFLADRSFWHDEVLVAVDLDELTLLSSLTNPSPRNQLAPAGFWVVSHLADWLGSSEEMLRLPTLIGGVVLIAATVWYAQAALERFVARVFLVATVAWSPPLIHYSSELKQYGMEATVSMVLLVMLVTRERLGRLGLTIGGIGALAFSLPALVLVPIFGVGWFIEEARTRGGAAALRHLAVPGTVLVVAQLGAYAFAQRTEPTAVRGFWTSAFAPLPYRPAAIEWWVDSILGIVHLLVLNVGIAGHLPIDAWRDPSTWLVTVAFVGLIVGGVVVAVRSRRGRDGAQPVALTAWRSTVPLITVVAVVFAALAVVEVYPLRGRLIVFLVPLLLVAAAHGIDVLVDRGLAGRGGAGPGPMTVLVGGAAVLVAGAALISAVGVLADPYRRFDMAGALTWVEERAEPGDTLIIELSSDAQWIHYRAQFDLDGVTVERRALDAVAGELDAAEPGGTVWFVHAFVTRSHEDRVDQLAVRDDVLDEFREDGTVALQITPR